MKETDKLMEIEWKKIKRVALGNATAQEVHEVKNWMHDNDERREFLEHTIYYYKEGQDKDELSFEDIARGWKKVRPRKSVYKRIVVWSTAAAVLAGLVFGTFFMLDRRAAEVLEINTSGTVQLILSDGTRHEIGTGEHISIEVPGFKVGEQGELKQVYVPHDTVAEKKMEYNEIVVPRCGEYQLTLADGTRVILNSESSIKFPAFFDGGERRVYLSGEGYFEVAHEADRPFLVEAGEAEIRVLGTRFNVKAYRGDPVFTTLVSGQVRVGAFADSLVLSPGQQCEVNPGSRQLTVGKADMESVLAWKNGEFVFKDITLERVMEELARWYDMQIEYENEKLKGIRLYIYVERSETLEEVLNKLALTGEFKYQVNGKKVRIQRQ